MRGESVRLSEITGEVHKRIHGGVTTRYEAGEGESESESEALCLCTHL